MRYFGLIPPLLLTAVYVMLVGAAGIKAVQIMGYVVLALLYFSAWLLIRKVWAGCVFGMMGGVLMIWFGIQNSGQLIREWPAGIAIFLFYMLAGYVLNMRDAGTKSGKSK
ncbi:MAG: hypothetical protein K6A40_07215 [Solobacterium sp.]|nr:hypothetical protein [Solobacterium sp.]